MTESTATQQLRLVRGGVYRNPAGGELRLIEPATSMALKRYGVHISSAVAAGLWIAEDHDELFGTTPYLATAKGLASCGYALISEPTGGAE